MYVTQSLSSIHQGEMFTLSGISSISPRLYIPNELVYVIKKLANKENCKYTHEVCSGVYAEAKFLDVIGTKVLRVFLTITSSKDLKLVC